MKGFPPKHTGFTLIELLIVIAIIGILTTIGYTSYKSSLARARDATRKSDLTKLKTALEAYYSANGSYPTTGGAEWGGCSGFGGKGLTGSGGYIPDLAPKYIDVLPADPRTGQSYLPCSSTTNTCYVYESDGVDYKLRANCTPESYPTGDPFIDPVRTTTAWAVCSSLAVCNSW